MLVFGCVNPVPENLFEVNWTEKLPDPLFFLGGGKAFFLKFSPSRDDFLSGSRVSLNHDRPVGFLIAQIARIFKNDRLLLGDTADGFETWLTNYCKGSLSWNLYIPMVQDFLHQQYQLFLIFFGEFQHLNLRNREEGKEVGQIVGGTVKFFFCQHSSKVQKINQIDVVWLDNNM